MNSDKSNNSYENGNGNGKEFLEDIKERARHNLKPMAGSFYRNNIDEEEWLEKKIRQEEERFKEIEKKDEKIKNDLIIIAGKYLPRALHEIPSYNERQKKQSRDKFIEWSFKYAKSQLEQMEARNAIDNATLFYNKVMSSIKNSVNETQAKELLETCKKCAKTYLRQYDIMDEIRRQEKEQKEKEKTSLTGTIKRQRRKKDVNKHEQDKASRAEKRRRMEAFSLKIKREMKNNNNKLIDLKSISQKKLEERPEWQF